MTISPKTLNRDLSCLNVITVTMHHYDYDNSYFASIQTTSVFLTFYCGISLKISLKQNNCNQATIIGL